MIKKYLFSFSLLVFNFTLFGQLNPTWQEWIENNSYSISITDTVNFQDFSILKEVLKDKKIVFLGENAHGVSEFTTIKARMIRYLHEELGFDVLAFESNFADAYAANLMIPESDVHSSIHNSISLLWHVEEIVPLFNYIKKTHSTKNPLNVAGIDLNLCNASCSFSHLLYNLISPIDSSYARDVYKSDSLFVRLGVRRWLNIATKEEKDDLNELDKKQSQVYAGIINFMEKNKDKYPDDKKSILDDVKVCLETRMDYPDWRNCDSSFMANKLMLIGKRWNRDKLWNRYRDYKMTQYLKVLTEKLYPTKKIIVWAENSHVSKTIYRMPSDTSYSNSVYTIGLFCYSGQGSSWPEFNGTERINDIYNFKTPVDSNSIENILHQSNNEITFVDMQQQVKCSGNSWMFEMTKNSGWDGSERDEVEGIKNKWDGLLLVNKINPPKFLKYKYEYLRKK